jgi:hypothetical protein
MSGGCELVIASAAAVLRDLPFGGNELVSFEAVECRIQRTFLDAESAIGSRLDVECDSEAVIGPSREGLED